MHFFIVQGIDIKTDIHNHLYKHNVAAPYELTGFSMKSYIKGLIMN
jgi:hypothetical protein